MADRRPISKVYGLRNPLQSVFPEPIIAQRAPTAGDHAQLGQMWVDRPLDDVYIATSVAAGATTWVAIAGGGSTFANITITAGYNQTGGTFAFAGTTFDVNATGAITLDSGAASNFSVAGAGIDLTLDSAAGRVVVDGGEAAADAVRILASDVAGGIDVDAGTAGVAIGSTGAIALNAAAESNFSVAGAGIDLILNSDAGAVLIDGGEAAANAVRIVASDVAGGIDVDAGTAGIAVDSTGSISLDGAADSNFSVSGAGIDLTLASAAGRVVIDGGEAAADAVRIVASDVAGGIDIDSGTGDLNLASTGQIGIESSADITAAIAISADGGTSESIVVNSIQGTGTDAISLEADVGGIQFIPGLDGQAFTVEVDNGTSEFIYIHSNQSTLDNAIHLEATAGGITLESAAAEGVKIDNATQVAGIYVGTGTPNGSLTAPQGSIFLNVAGSGVSDRMFVNSDGAMAWVAFTTVS